MKEKNFSSQEISMNAQVRIMKSKTAVQIRAAPSIANGLPGASGANAAPDATVDLEPASGRKERSY